MNPSCENNGCALAVPSFRPADAASLPLQCALAHRQLHDSSQHEAAAPISRTLATENSSGLYLHLCRFSFCFGF